MLHVGPLIRPRLVRLLHDLRCSDRQASSYKIDEALAATIWKTVMVALRLTRRIST